MKSFQIGDLTIPVPIIQGGMGIGISLSGLASAVATAGGIGTIATVGVGLIHGTSDKTFKQNNIEGVIREIRKARQQTKGVLAVNIMSVLTNFTELVQTSIKEKIDIIFSGEGLPLDLPKYKPKESSTNKDIRLIESPVGLPGRAIENDFLPAAERSEKRPKSCKYHCIKSCNPKTTNYCIADALLSAYYGKFDSGFAFSGANGYTIKSITSVKEVFQHLIIEYNNK